MGIAANFQKMNWHRAVLFTYDDMNQTFHVEKKNRRIVQIDTYALLLLLKHKNFMVSSYSYLDL